MIYLIKTTLLQQGEHEEDDNLIFSYKIGYSDDSRGKVNGVYRRFADYINSGLSFRVIKTIPGGSVKLEHCIQKKFSKYRVEGRSMEWFYFSSEIRKFFDKCETELDLYKSLGFESEENFNSSFEKQKVEPYKPVPPINRILNFDEIIKSNVNLLDEDILNTLTYMRDNCNNFTKALKYICEELDQDRANIVVSYLPRKIQNYYNVLGPDKLRALAFRNDNIKEAYDREVSNQTIDIKSIILNEFTVGNRYPKSEIKEKLKRIYLDAGYEKTAKATDLQNYFNIKQCEITRPEDKTRRDSGFVILSVINP